ncbi:uncharacterized protein LOC125177610 [Hyalella azteca]|uniref:Uncharacterized protein LOC125177610 n=1 Tax=Hyalella azteca TaxID=294128 RepID=A0A979FG79_HYAAZ|nr:uncharacterized protein LOC125177610 [Hyalella azteca]
MKNSTPCIEPIEVAEPLPPKLNSRQRVTTRQTNTLPLDGSLEVESRIQQPQSTAHPAASVISVRSASENNSTLFSTDRQSILDTEQSLQQETDADLLSIRTPHTPSSSRPGRSYLETRRISRLDPIIEPDSRIPSALARESSRPSTSTARVPGTILVRSTTPHPGYGQASTSTLREELPTVVDSMASALDELAVLRAEEGPHIDPDNGVRPMSILYGNRPLSVRRHSAHRPASTLNSRPRSTNVCRARSGLYNWSNLKRSSSHDLSHLPPAGPDCLPGCGYSGLPCYVCSSKRYQEQYKLRESPAHRTFGLEFPIWTIFRYGGHRASRVDPYPVPVHHLNLHRRGHNRGRGHGPPPSYTSLFPEASCLGLKKCLEICRYSRITTMILVVLLILSIIYVLIIAGHFKQGK